MPDDIYTKRLINIESREHVIPNSLGGRLQTVGLIDQQLNSDFGATIDSRLDKALLAFRTCIDARSHRTPSTPAPPIRGVEGADGERYRVEAGGKTKIRPNLSVTESGGKVKITGRVANEKELRQALKNLAKKKGWDLDELVATLFESADHRRGVPPQMTFPITLWDHDPYRAIVKMVCNLFALHYHSVFLRPEFDAIRDFVLNGTGLPPCFIQATDIDIRRDGMGPLDHLVTVEIDSIGHVRGMVVLFGVLAFVVRLGDLGIGTASRHSYRIDQLTHADRHNHVEDCSLPIEPFEQASARSYEDFALLAKEQLNRLLPDLLRIQKDVWLRGLIEPHWNRLLEDMGDAVEPTDEAKLEFSSTVARVVTAELLLHIEAAAQKRRAEAASFSSPHGYAIDSIPVDEETDES